MGDRTGRSAGKGTRRAPRQSRKQARMCRRQTSARARLFVGKLYLAECSGRRQTHRPAEEPRAAGVKKRSTLAATMPDGCPIAWKRFWHGFCTSKHVVMDTTRLTVKPNK